MDEDWHSRKKIKRILTLYASKVCTATTKDIRFQGKGELGSLQVSKISQFYGQVRYVPCCTCFVSGRVCVRK